MIVSRSSCFYHGVVLVAFLRHVCDSMNMCLSHSDCERRDAKIKTRFSKHFARHMFFPSVILVFLLLLDRLSCCNMLFSVVFFVEVGVFAIV